MRNFLARLRAAWWVASNADRAVVHCVTVCGRSTFAAEPPGYFGRVQHQWE